MPGNQMGRLAWRLAACAAGLLAANVHASPGPLGTQDAMLSSNPYALAPVQSGPLSSLGAAPSRNVYLPSGVVVDAHGRELALTRYNNPEPMNATGMARPGLVYPPAAESSHPGTTGGSPTEHPSVNNPDGTAPMPAAVPGIVADVPEPSSFALMAAGLVGLAWATRRKIQRRR